MTPPLAETHLVSVANLMGYTFGVATGHFSYRMEKVCL